VLCAGGGGGGGATCKYMGDLTALSGTCTLQSICETAVVWMVCKRHLGSSPAHQMSLGHGSVLQAVA
jgi:hypothetical protein